MLSQHSSVMESIRFRSLLETVWTGIVITSSSLGGPERAIAEVRGHSTSEVQQREKGRRSETAGWRKGAGTFSRPQTGETYLTLDNGNQDGTVHEYSFPT